MKFNAVTLALALSAASTVSQASTFTTTVFFDDFEGGGSQYYRGVESVLTGGVNASTQGYSTMGFGDSFYALDYRDRSSRVIELSLSNLPTHDFLSVSGLLAVINSWDGDRGDKAWSYDLFLISLDGQNLTESSFPHSVVPNRKPLGDWLAGSGSQLYSLPGDSATWVDRGINFHGNTLLTNVAHTGSSAVIRFEAFGYGFQGGADESFAIDSLRVDVSSAPITLQSNLNFVDVPVAGAFSLGMLGLFAFARRKDRY